MKKTALLGLAAIAALGFTACNNSNSASQMKGDNKVVLYSGILPAADVQGTMCTIKLDFDDDNNYTDGDFVMIENSLAADTVAASGLKDVATSYSEGDFRKESKQVNGVNVEYIVLTPDADEVFGAASSTPTYLIINPDQSLTLVNSSIEMPANPELYTLSVR